MSFQRYPKYKDSGVEWLGDIPEHWRVKRLRFAAEINPSKSEVAKLDSETIVSFLPMEAIGEDGTLDLSREKSIVDVESGYTYVREGDVAFAKITPCFENGKGALMRGLTNGIGFGTTELVVARPRSGELTSQYLHLLFTSEQFRRLGESHMYGAGGQKRVPESFVRDFSMPLPPIAEQCLVSRFLEREAAKIDALLAEQQRLIELLREKRQAVVSHAVTNGLNPDAPLKPTGVKWLGEVPEAWRVVPLKRVADVHTGVAKGKDNGSRPTVSVPYLRVANVQDGYLNLDAVAEIEIPIDDLERQRLKKGDVLMNEGGDFDKLGRGHVWDGQIEPCITQNHVFAVRPRLVSPQWLNAITGSEYARFYFMSRSKQSTNLASISSTNLMELSVVLPPEREQVAILTYVAEQTSNFDRLVAEAQRFITLLGERRTALISAAVTGKIDVRHLAGAEAA